MFPHPSIPVTMTLLVLLGTFILPCHNYHSLLIETKLSLLGTPYLLSHGHLEGSPPAPTYGWSSNLYHPSLPTIVTKPVVCSHKVMWSIMGSHSLTAYCRQPPSPGPLWAIIVLQTIVGNHSPPAHRGQP